MKIPDYYGLDWGMDWVVSWIGLNDNFWTGFWTVNNYGSDTSVNIIRILPQPPRSFDFAGHISSIQ